MAQYIYILINPSLKGLLKIGRTDRSPEERAIELSNSSNMPTPFIVAYDEKVPDSKTAEKLIHDELMQQGFRVSDSREFFSIPLKNAIQVVSQVSKKLRESMSTTTSGFSDNAETNEKTTAQYYLLQGLEAMNGSRSTLQDYTVARDCFEKAITMGCVEAYIFLAFLYIRGNGVRQSSEMALKILKAGGDKGDPECYKTMTDIYEGNTSLDVRHEGNAEVCFLWYLNAVKEGIGTTAFSDYLYSAYEKFGGNITTWGQLRFPIKRFPGKFVSAVIDMWIDKIRLSFHEIGNARIIDISINARLPLVLMPLLSLT